MIISRVAGLLGLLPGAFAYKALSDDSLRNIPDPGDDFDIKQGALLASILQPRVPGTPGSTAVLNHFVDFFHKELPAWELTFQNSSSKTPISGSDETPFVNLIATRDPPWAGQGHVGRLALVAHYDSKIDPPGFIGAIDSAAPCAMIMHAARSLDAALTNKWSAMEAEGESELEEASGIQVILLDGEEAFKVWTDSDSIYGARYDQASYLD
jgi:glutaminyl-peptide cyclotransferase